MAKAYSVSFRLQRVTTESADVSILLTPDFFQASGTGPVGKRINIYKLVQVAIEEGRLPSTVWKLDGEPVIKPHPVQTPPDVR
jgi:hypothetical protein